MRKFLSGLWMLLCPCITLADPLSFAPPPSDNSVVFLGNIFGIVDGVLHGSGSQIMGSIFSVFNAAVLALGGIVIMYTLIVGTMNTAQEGEMLGHKWSSIWIPVRATLGLALLIPKASGYCLIQIFVMWIVVQGVGAADKVWGAALSYLNRGGVIIHSQMAPPIAMSADSNAIALGARTMLAGQVCMLGIQRQLENQKQNYQSQKEKGGGPCAGKPTGVMEKFCGDSIPDFINSVNMVTAQNKNPTNPSTPMPNFDSGSNYASLNGICGTLKWQPLGEKNEKSIADTANLSASESETVNLSRAIALQQMYMDLSMVARTMVNNDPQINNMGHHDGDNDFSPVATSQFGIPYLKTGSPCNEADPGCTQWGTDPSKSTPQLFNGTEFQGAVIDYNAIMLPTLKLMNQASESDNTMKARKFINDSKSQGWALAGSYFFDLVQLNGLDAASDSPTDTKSGVNESTFSTDSMLSPFKAGGCTNNYTDLCTMLNHDSTPISEVVALIDGTGILPQPLSPPSNLSSTGMNSVITGLGSSTVYGFVNNASLINLPGQVGNNELKFKFKIDVKPKASGFKLPGIGHRCYGKLMGYPCVASTILNGLYNHVIKFIFDQLMDMTEYVFQLVILNFLTVPLALISQIFDQGVKYIASPGANPILGLAQMGSYYINASMDLWLQLLSVSLIFELPLLSNFQIVFELIKPLFITWMSIMVGIGFTTAFYIPFLPYMIFTFGVIAWLIAVIEAMVAAPIVALGITHPEGEGALGKGEQALMILMNVFLRPSMMIIGYIAGIMLSYVSVWMINAGFGHVSSFMTAKDHNILKNYNWTSMFSGFFIMLIYTMIYLTVVQKAFTMIYILPDKVLRWIGGQQEQLGQDIAQWSEESKGQIKDAGDKSRDAGGMMTKTLSDKADELLGKSKDANKKPPSVGAGGGS